MKRNIKIFPTPQILAEELAAELVNCINSYRDIITIAISGGKTPEMLFTILGDRYADSVDWDNVHFFWVDERCVPPEDPESNYGMIERTLLRKINIHKRKVHRIKGEDNPVSEAERYSAEIKKYVTFRRSFPSFNIILLGLGEDGHTASIFPGKSELFLSDNFCEVAEHPQTGQKRITITGKVINNAEQIFFLIAGRSKAQIVKEVIDRDTQELDYPGKHINPVSGTICFYLDEAAGSLLKK
jgi:6-phosphogluconolactonase